MLAGAALCEPAPAVAPLAFEVASIKPAAPMGSGPMRIGVRNDGAMVTYSNMSLTSLVQNAYRVKDFQVTGPEWMSSTRWDISAKLPDGASKDDAPDMLQGLLKERFKVNLHQEKKDHPIYALVVGKSGSKLKAAEVTADAGPAGPPRAAGGEGGRFQTTVAAGSGGHGGPPAGNGMMMRMGPNGGHIESKAVTVTRFAEMISRFMDRPVVDQTGIAGNYDFALDFSQEEMAGAMSQMRGTMMAGGMPPPGHVAPSASGPEGPPNAPEGGSVFQSIQQYGLKLEPKKAPMDIITIDSAEKTPTEN
jgi:uncharacterized protein (TIGR03435 family)